MILESEFLILGFEILSFEIRISDLESDFLSFFVQYVFTSFKCGFLGKKLEESEFLIWNQNF